MNSATHTPGPWSYKYGNGDEFHQGQWYNIESENGNVLQFPYRVGEEKEKEFEANAKLVAAAPVLLEALQSANNYFIDLQNKCALTNSDERAWKLISKAIKKATE